MRQRGIGQQTAVVTELGRVGSSVGRPVGLGAVLVVALGLVGCSGLEPVATFQPITDPAQLYTTLQLNHHGITLATDASNPAYNTIQLTATPLNGLGMVMTGLSAPTFDLSDSGALSRTSDGVVTALRTGDYTVIASLVSGDNIRHADTTFLHVTSTVPAAPLGSVSIHVPPDSAVLPIFGSGDGHVATLYIAYFGGLYDFFKILNPVALDNAGHPMSGLLAQFKSLNPLIADVNPTTGEFLLHQPGHVDFVVELTAYGVTKTDTAAYTVTQPIEYQFSITDTGFVPSRAIVTKNALVGWRGIATGQLMDVTFDDPTNVVSPSDAMCIDAWGFVEAGFGIQPGPYCGTGNIAQFTGGQSNDEFALLPDGSAAIRQRQFPVPGVYKFRNTVSGATGTLEVVDE